jgi:hypothetical protein
VSVLRTFVLPLARPTASRAISFTASCCAAPRGAFGVRAALGTVDFSTGRGLVCDALGRRGRVIL